MPDKNIVKEKLREIFLISPDKHFKINEISKIIKISSESPEFTLIREAIDELERENFIRRMPHRQFTLMKKETTVTGRFQIRRGEAFVMAGDEKLNISRKDARDALDGDRVSVQIEENSFGERKAKVIDITERDRHRVVGTIRRKRGILVVIPDDSALPEFPLSTLDTKKVREGEKVVLKLEYRDRAILSSVEKSLGKAGDARVEIESVIEEYELPKVFPKDVNREAESLPEEIPAEETARRRDLRNLRTFTIDPADARDFDDAISVEDLGNGSLRLGVHIADVSYYVPEGSVLDHEAYYRATSVYLIGGVVPMLPERISNDLCSLKPNVDRLAFTAMMTLNEKAEVNDYEIFRSIIHSDHRFTYEEAQIVIDTKQGPHVEELLKVADLAKKLRADRMKAGSIDFESVEVKFHYDEQGVPIGATRKDRLDSMKLIEECMLLANKIVATHISKMKEGGKSVPFVYRIHDSPRSERLEDLAAIAKHLGYTFDPVNVTSKRIQHLLDEVHGKPEEFLVNELALRSMSKAIYDVTNIGHYGLAFAHYTHFTSPIRRYPDLLVHRLIDEYNRGMSKSRHAHWLEHLPEMCQHSSDRERRATEAERASTKVALAVLATGMIGDEHDAAVSGVMRFGIFVELLDIPIEGLIKIRALGEESFAFDERAHTLVGRSTRKKIQLGDKLRVKIIRVDIERREVDLEIVGGGKQKTHASDERHTQKSSSEREHHHREKRKRRH